MASSKGGPPSQGKRAFRDSGLNITSQGRPYLGAPLGTEEYSKQFVTEKVLEWKEELLQLANVALPQPHVAFAAFNLHMALSINSPTCQEQPKQ